MQNQATQVFDDLRTVLGHAQRLVESGTATSRRAGASLLEVKDRALLLEQQAMKSAQETAEELDRYAHEHPWRVLIGGIAIAAIVAAAFTLIASSKRD